MRDARPRTITLYQIPNSNEPFTEWFRSIRDTRVKERIQARLIPFLKNHVALPVFMKCGAGQHKLKVYATNGRYIIRNGITSVKAGNLGDYKFVGDGVWELRLDFGTGYRIYYGEVDKTIVLLFCGGGKSLQQRDIERAKNYWTEYKERHKK
jgi:putative addiction module killer protein